MNLNHIQTFTTSRSIYIIFLIGLVKIKYFIRFFILENYTSAQGQIFILLKQFSCFYHVKDYSNDAAYPI